MHDDGAAVPRQQLGRVVVGGARVDHDRQSQVGREVELLLEEAALLGAPVGAVVVIEARLPHRDRSLVAQQLAQLADPAGLALRRLVRVDAEGGVDAVVFRELERPPAGVDARPDRDDARHPRLASAYDGDRRLLERIEVRVCVDHVARARQAAAAARSIRASSSSTTCFGSSFANNGFGSRSARPGSSSLGCHRPVHAS